jgi:hypothetical protein
MLYFVCTDCNQVIGPVGDNEPDETIWRELDEHIAICGPLATFKLHVDTDIARKRADRLRQNKRLM